MAIVASKSEVVSHRARRGQRSAPSVSMWWTWGNGAIAPTPARPKNSTKVNIIWQIEEKRDAWQVLFAAEALHSIAPMKKHRCARIWNRGGAAQFTDDELAGFDLENACWVRPAMICVVQAAVSGQVYANVTAIMKGSQRA